jgi:hypothetical protein
MSWAAEELRNIDLGDARRDKRAAQLLERLSEKPTASLPGAMNGWTETMAAYRFLAQDEVDWMDILRPHQASSLERMMGHDVVLCIQDTTELDFNGQQIAGLGPLSYEAQRGLYLHPTYAVTVDREPLGVLDAWLWAREFKDADGQRGGEKESARWLSGYEPVATLSEKLPQTRLVYVADREADIMALMVKARDLGAPADWLLRCQHDRNLRGGKKLWARVTAGRALGTITFALPSRHGQKTRRVKQRLWARRVALPAGKAGVVEATCIVAKEFGAPNERRQARGVASVDQSRGKRAGSGDGADRLVSGSLGDRDVLPRAEEWLPRGGGATVDARARKAGASVVHGGCVAHRETDAARAALSRLGRWAMLRPR